MLVLLLFHSLSLWRLKFFWWYPLWFLRPRRWIFTLHVAVLIHLCVFRLLFLFYFYKKEYNLTLNRYFPGLDFTCWFLLFHLFARDVNKLRYFIIIIIIVRSITLLLFFLVLHWFEWVGSCYLSKVESTSSHENVCLIHLFCFP